MLKKIIMILFASINCTFLIEKVNSLIKKKQKITKMNELLEGLDESSGDDQETDISKESETGDY